jgi:uncharacterized protein YndB with AHSA1/START domain
MSDDTTGRSRTSRSTFRLEYAVGANIRAKPTAVWALLTDAPGFPRWNSTVTRIDGTIARGERLALRVPLAPERVFKPKVTELVENERMVWSDGAAPMFKGVRTFTLAPRGDGTTDFSMIEVLSGVMLPMIKGSLPDFGPAFETYAADLKREAERTNG